MSKLNYFGIVPQASMDSPKTRADVKAWFRGTSDLKDINNIAKRQNEFKDTYSLDDIVETDVYAEFNINDDVDYNQIAYIMYAAFGGYLFDDITKEHYFFIDNTKSELPYNTIYKSNGVDEREGIDSVIGNLSFNYDSSNNESPVTFSADGNARGMNIVDLPLLTEADLIQYLGKKAMYHNACVKFNDVAQPFKIKKSDFSVASNISSDIYLCDRKHGEIYKGFRETMFNITSAYRSSQEMEDYLGGTFLGAGKPIPRKISTNLKVGSNELEFIVPQAIIAETPEVTNENRYKATIDLPFTATTVSKLSVLLDFPGEFYVRLKNDKEEAYVF